MIPEFRYHPDPISTGAVEASNAACTCCGDSRGYIYVAPIYSETDVESVCPWCIADGSAHRKYDAIFSDAFPLLSAGVPKEIIEEVTQRTPGYTSWQQEEWLACCGDACEFHGDAPKEDLRDLGPDDIASLSADTGFPVQDLEDIIKYYEPGGSPAFYKFVCRHCKQVKYGADCN